MRRADLPAISIFAAVAGRRSFRGAARELGLSVSAVSHAVSGLEESLGLRLLSRTTRSVAPTEAGRRLLEAVDPALVAIAEAVEAATAAENRLTGTIALSVPRSAAELVLVPLAAAFTRLHPDVSVEIIVEDGFTDIVASRFDAGVRLGESLERDMIAVPVGPSQRLAVVAAASYFDAHPRPRSPRDLADHLCVRRRFAGGGLWRWEFEKGDERIDVEVGGPLVLNDDRLIVEAAMAGAGLAMAFEAQIIEAVEDARLVRVLDDWCPTFPGFYFYFPDRRLMRAVLRAFIDFAKAGRA